MEVRTDGKLQLPPHRRHGGQVAASSHTAVAIATMDAPPFPALRALRASDATSGGLGGAVVPAVSSGQGYWARCLPRGTGPCGAAAPSPP